MELYVRKPPLASRQTITASSEKNFFFLFLQTKWERPVLADEVIFAETNMLTTLTCGVQQRPKNIQRVMVNGFPRCRSCIDERRAVKTSIQRTVSIQSSSFHFHLSSTGKRGVTTQRLTTSASGSSDATQTQPQTDL